ncbi:MAG: helicase-associated domain-containing protein [Thermoanaerobaculia bacterium]|nr:helicase-associated domain-containing protein [Thermoanaerobaculia bacterium]
MSLARVDWRAVLDRLPAWHALSLPARETALTLPPGDPVPLPRLGERGAELETASLVRAVDRGSRVEVASPFRPLLAALRRMKRSQVFERPGRAALERYLAQQLSVRELRELVAGRPGAGHELRRLVASRASSRSWVGGLLAPEGSDAAARAADGGSGPPLPADSRVVLECRRLVGGLVAAGEPVPAVELAAEHPDRDLLAAALSAGLARLWFLAGLTPDGRLPVVGIYPPALERIRRPRAGRPRPLEVERPYRSALLLDEMTTVLVAAVADPPRLTRSGSRLFARARRELEEALAPLPAPVARLLESSRADRVERAVLALSQLGYVESRGRPGEDLRLAATAAGEEWLAEDPKTRLQALLDLLRASRRDVPGGGGFLKETIRFLPRRTRRDLQLFGLELEGPLVEAYASLEPGQFVQLTAFLRHRAEEENPLAVLGAARRGGRAARGPLTDEQLERLWAEVLYDFFAERLFALGGAAVAVVEGDRLAFGVTDAGRYLLGLADDFEWQEDGGEIVVQPDFEVIFLAPSPPAEAALGRFARRRQKGRDFGSLFHITRDSIFAAAAGGLTAERVLATLDRLSSKPVPGNVRRQIEEWFARCRRVAAEPATLLRCPDRDTALLLLAAGGGALEPLGETVVAVRGKRLPAALKRKLRAAGIFVEPASG